MSNDELRLCFRCERRAGFLETGMGPRAQCKDEGAIGNCYAYLPVKPIVLKKAKGDRRPVGVPILIFARVERHKLADVDLRVLTKSRGKFVFYWEPKS